MSKPFHFKQFSIIQEKSAMKVGTDGVLLGAIVNVRFKKRILDIGTGTGLVALMMAQRSKAMIDAVEIDSITFEEASYNFEQSKWSDQIKIYHASFQHFAKSTSYKYDAIVCNPPYFSNSLKSPTKRRSLARHNDLLSFESLIKNASKLLADHGEFTVIISIEDKERFIELAAINHLYPSLILNIKPNPIKAVFRTLMVFSKVKKPSFETNLMIENEIHGNYTDDFIELTQEYYLAF